MLPIILLSLFVLSTAQQCSFSNGDVSAKWQVANGEIIIELTNKNIGNNQWTGIGFGSSMRDQDVVLFMIKNNRPKMVTGYTTDYAPPTLDQSPSVNAELIQYNSNTLVARFSRPLGASGPRNLNLGQCMTWNFVSGGRIEDGEVGYHHRGYQSEEICPRRCRKH